MFIESSYNVSDVEGQLLAVYDPKLIRDTLTELYENRGLNAVQIISLNDKVQCMCVVNICDPVLCFYLCVYHRQFKHTVVKAYYL